MNELYCGYTAVQAVFRNPDLADAHIAASATLQVPFFQTKLDETIRGCRGGKRRLILVMGENDFPTILGRNGELKEKIDQLAPDGLTCRFLVISKGEHVPPDALREGLRRLFEDKTVFPFSADAPKPDFDAEDQRLGMLRSSQSMTYGRIGELGRVTRRSGPFRPGGGVAAAESGAF